MWDCGNCQVQVKGRESGSRIRVWFIYDESGRRGRIGLGQAEGESIRFNDRGEEALTLCVGHDSSGDGRQR